MINSNFWVLILTAAWFGWLLGAMLVELETMLYWRMMGGHKATPLRCQSMAGVGATLVVALLGGHKATPLRLLAMMATSLRCQSRAGVGAIALLGRHLSTALPWCCRYRPQNHLHQHWPYREKAGIWFLSQVILT